MVIKRNDLDAISTLNDMVTLFHDHGFTDDVNIEGNIADIKIIDPLTFLRIVVINQDDDINIIIREHFKTNHVMYLLLTDFMRFVFVKRDLYPVTKFTKFGFKKNSIGRTTLDKINALEFGNVLTFEDLFEQKTIIDTFYAEYKAKREHLVKKIHGIPVETDRMLYAQIILDRIMFLYFVQKKGFLDNNEDYLSSKLKELGKDNFFEFFLRLCFDALSRSDRTKEFEGIPYLNGGLFRKHDLEETHEINIPNESFKEILEFFGKWNWYVDEHVDYLEENQISPEILGHIFEKTVNQRQIGAYYTPKKITDYMSHKAISRYILNDLKRGGIDVSSISNVFNGTNDDMMKLYMIIRDLKVCDNACGSGAFLLAVEGYLFDLITQCITIMRDRNIFASISSDDRKFGDLILDDSGSEISSKEEYAIKKEIIASNLYGVDIDAGAIEICKLRLWLSLMSQIIDVDKLEPLPNMEYHITCGNSLLGFVDVSTLFPLEKFLNGESINDRIRHISDLKHKYRFEVDSTVTRQLNQEISTSVKDMRSQLNNQLLAIITKDKRNRVTRTNFESLQPFHWVLEFCEIFFGPKKGFDIVIGNPPYIKEYTNKDAFDGLRSSSYYMGKMDLWYIFGSRSLDILHEKGIECYIATNNWVTNMGANKFRNDVMKRSMISMFTDFGDYKVFENVGVQTMIYLLMKGKPSLSYESNYSKTLKKTMTFDELDDYLYGTITDKEMLRHVVVIKPKDIIDKYVQFLTKDMMKIFTMITTNSVSYLTSDDLCVGIDVHHDFLNKKNAKLLHDKYPVGSGIFVITDEELEALSLTANEKNLIKPYYTTNELGRYHGDPMNKYHVIYTKSNIDKIIDRYPNIKRHLDKFRDIITSDFKPYGLHRARDEKLFLGNTVVATRKCAYPIFTYCDFDAYVSQTFYVIKTKKWNMKYLAGLLSSKMIAFWLFHKGKMQGSNYQLDSAPLRAVPIINASREEQKRVATLVDKILEIARSDIADDKKTKRIDEIEEKINDIIYALYGLSPEAIREIKNS